MSRGSRFFILTIVCILTLTATAAAFIHRHRVQRPPASEFGGGPRTSAGGAYQAMLHGIDDLRPRKMYSVVLDLEDADGKPIEDASIDLDGGMPQHGHGFPTAPRVTRHLGEGQYEISGLRFNMGGWWELKVRVTSAAGTEVVTFNLEI